MFSLDDTTYHQVDGYDCLSANIDNTSYSSPPVSIHDSAFEGLLTKEGGEDNYYMDGIVGESGELTF